MDKVTEINCATGEVVERPMTEEEQQVIANSQEDVETGSEDVVALLLSKIAELENKINDLA